jgi:hypothetical protein
VRYYHSASAFRLGRTGLYLTATVLTAAAACGQPVTSQSTITQYVTDVNGHRVLDATFTSAARNGQTLTSELTQSINGRQVPLQQTETRILSEGPAGRKTETIIRKYSPTGELASTEKVVTEEQKTGEGRSTIRATISRSDIQGRLVEAERRTIDTETQGNRTVSNVIIARPSLNGSFVPAEKRNIVTVDEKDATREVESILRPTQAGQFAESAREVRETQKSGGKITENHASYELDYAGRLQVWKQESSTTSKSADGTQVTELNIYAVNSDGVPRDERGGMKIKEQQIIVRTPAGKEGFIETTSIRRPTLADQNRLGSPTKILETMCTGNCGPSATKP